MLENVPVPGGSGSVFQVLAESEVVATNPRSPASPKNSAVVTQVVVEEQAMPGWDRAKCECRVELAQVEPKSGVVRMSSSPDLSSPTARQMTVDGHEMPLSGSVPAGIV